MLGVRQKNFLKFPLKFVLLNRLYALINSLMRRLLNCVFSVACLAVLIKMQFCVWKQSFPFFDELIVALRRRCHVLETGKVKR